MRNGYCATLLGSSATLPIDTNSQEGLEVFARIIKDTYGISEKIEYILTNNGGISANDSESIDGYLRQAMKSIDAAHVRDPELISLLNDMKIPFCYEDHNEDYHLSAKAENIAALQNDNCRLVVAITSTVAIRLANQGVPTHKIVVEHSGVRTGENSRDHNRISSWRRFLLSPGFRGVAFYGGGLQAERGISQILDAAYALPSLLFVIAGGSRRDAAALLDERKKRGLRNVKICGFVESRVFVELAQSSDVLLFTRGHGDKNHITSPLKFFEYLVCGSPVVAFNIDAVRQVCASQMAVTLYSDPSGGALVEAIVESLHLYPWKPDGYPANVASAAPYDWVLRERRIIDRLIHQKVKS